jgi:hypothetical protein
VENADGHRHSRGFVRLTEASAFDLERTGDGRAEFLFVSLWESMEAVVGFAGVDVDRAVYSRDDELVLLERTMRVEHY